MRRLWLIVALTLMPVASLASQDSSFAQTHLDAVFWIDRQAQMTTAGYGIGFVTEDLSPRDWVFALPPGAEYLGVAPATLPDLIARYTPSSFYTPEPEGYCGLSPTFIYFDGYGTSTVRMQVAPLTSEPASVSLDEAAALMPGQQNALTAYSDAGWSFMRITFAPQPNPETDDEFISAVVQRPPLIIVRYPGTTPILPLRFHGDDLLSVDDYDFEQTGSVRSRVAIFADESYTSAAPTSLDFSHVRRESLLRGAMTMISSPLEPPDAAWLLYLAALHRADGFIRTWVGSPPPQVPVTDFYRDAATYYDQNALPVLSYFDAALTTLGGDLGFIPDGPAPQSARMYPTSADINPLTYWGCTSRTLYDPVLEAALPPGRTRIDSLGVMLAHPDDWRLSEVAHGFVLAPEVVDAAEIAAIESGQIDFPALVISAQVRRYEGDEYSVPSLPGDLWMGLTTGEAVPPSAFTWLYFPERMSPEAFWPLSETTRLGEPFEGVEIGLYVPASASEEDAARWHDLYKYAQSMQFITAPDLRHTLYLGRDGLAAGIGYPEGWIEQTKEGFVLLLPEGESADTAPSIELARSDSDTDMSAIGSILPYDQGGRRGYVVQTGAPRWPRAIITAPAGTYAQHRVLLEHLANSLRPHVGYGAG